MDDWGDPWADNAAKRPPDIEILGASKETVVTPVLAGFFEDEAQWDKEEEVDAFAGWTDAEAERGPVAQTSTETPAWEPTRAEDEDAVKTAQSHGEDATTHPPAHTDEAYSSGREETVDARTAQPLNDAKPPSETEGQSGAATAAPAISIVPEVDSSDSGTTIGPEVAGFAAADPAASSAITPPEEFESGASTRPSTSPSEVSHGEILSDSTRTSFEDDSAGRNTDGDGKDEVEGEEPVTATVKEVVEEDDFGDFEEETEDSVHAEDTDFATASPAQAGNASLATSPEPSPDTAQETDAKASETGMATTNVVFQPDVALISQLFPNGGGMSSKGDADDTPISSTSARKAWYRITRNETMREFESGTDVNNYVRVGWQGSTIRTEVDKIVTRWTSEDRINGRTLLGGKPGVIFGWDYPASPSGGVFSHKRNASANTPITPAFQADSKPRPQSLAIPSTRKASLTDGVPIAQFSWSSSQAADDVPNPWASSAPASKTSFGHKTDRHEPMNLASGQEHVLASAPATKTSFESKNEPKHQSLHIPALMQDSIPSSAPPSKTTFASQDSKKKQPRPTSMILPKVRKEEVTHKRSASSVSFSRGSSASSLPVKSTITVLDNPWGRTAPRSPLAQSMVSHEDLNDDNPWGEPAPSAVVEESSQKPPDVVSTSKPSPELPVLDTSLGSPQAKTAAEEDDGWGEMVESPVPSPVIIAPDSNPWGPPSSSTPVSPSPTKTMTKLAPLDTSIAPFPVKAAADDEDDEWGEMVQSPASSSPGLAPPPSDPWQATRSISPINLPRGTPTRSRPLSPLVPAPMRSATTPLSGSPSFIPPPRQSSPLAMPSPWMPKASNGGAPTPNSSAKLAPARPFSPLNPAIRPSSTPNSTPFAIPQPQPPKQAINTTTTTAPASDPWATADFSIFEKPAAPRHSMTHNRTSSSPTYLFPQNPNKSSPRPLSTFDNILQPSSPRAWSTTSSTPITFDQILQPSRSGSATTFDQILQQPADTAAKPQHVQVPSRSVSPAVTVSAEDEIKEVVRKFTHGLPDLGYMLR